MTENKQTQNLTTEQYQFLVKLAARAASGSALLLVVLKLYAWFVTDASAMLASATDSMLDFFASMMNLIILRFALAPADKEHKFGHGKAESLAGLVQSAFVLGSAILLVITGVERLAKPVAISHSEQGIIITIISIVVTLALVVLQKYVIRKTGSVAISADGMHYQSDLMMNLGVLVAIVLANGIWLHADGVFTILVGLYLLWGAGQIIWGSVHHLMDHELPKEEIDQIIAIALKNDKALGIHDIRTRQSGQQRFIQFHLELDDNMPLVEAHDIGETIEHEILEKLAPCEVFIHHDPVSSIGTDVEKITR
jgi:ferrous-iron efflux pump FieF